MRIALDTNLYVSALLNVESVPAQVFLHVIHHHQLLLSEALLDELYNVLQRAKFRPYFSTEEAAVFLQRVQESGAVIQPTATITACRDAKDNHLLELAVSGNADYLITGDDDLLVLNPFQGVKILTPAAWSETL